MADEPGIWEKMLSKLGSAQAEASDPKRNAYINPQAKDAQARATAHYFKTGESLPLDAYLNDPTLK